MRAWRRLDLLAGLFGLALLGIVAWQSATTMPGGDEGTCGSIFAPVGGNCDRLYERAVTLAPLVLGGAFLLGLSLSLRLLRGRRLRRLASIVAAGVLGVGLAVLYLVVAAHLTDGHGGR